MKRPALLIVLALALVAGLLLWQRHAAERPLDKVGTVSLAASLTLSAAPVWIAQDHGLFARAGLDASIRQVDTGKIATETMLKAEVDLAPATEFKAIETAFTRKDLRILGTTSFMHSTRLLALKEKGIAKPADLKGKRVGVSFGTNGTYLLARLLTLNGLSRGDIEWVDLKPQAMIDALAAGKVDAVMVWSPFSLAIKQHFADRIASFDGQPGQDFYYLMLGRDDWLARHPEVAERVMLALKWATDWMAAHPEEAQAYMATKFAVKAANIAEEMRESRFAVGLPQALLTAMEGERAWLSEQGTKGTPPANTLDLIAFDPLSKVAPESVTIVRGR